MSEPLRLKLCPFCGHPGQVFDDWEDETPGPFSRGLRWSVGCSARFCPALPHTNLHEKAEDAIAAWNTRAGDHSNDK